MISFQRTFARRREVDPGSMVYFDTKAFLDPVNDSLASCHVPKARHVARLHDSLARNFLWNLIWVCLKMGYTPNYSHLVGIMISKTIGCRGTRHFQTNPFDLICTCGVTVLRCLLRLCASSAGPCQIKDFFAAFESSPLNYSYIVEQEDRWAVETEAVRTLGYNLRKRQTLNFDIRLRCPFTSFTCAADGGRKSMKAVGMDVTYVR